MFALWKSLVVCLPSETGQMARARALLSRGSRAGGFYIETNYAELEKKKKCIAPNQLAVQLAVRGQEEKNSLRTEQKYLALCLQSSAKKTLLDLPCVGNRAETRRV